MIKHTKNSLKFNKLLKSIFDLKVKLFDTQYEKDIQMIDQQARLLFEVYNNSKTVKEEVNTKINNLSKQNAYLKYQHFIKKKGNKEEIQW